MKVKELKIFKRGFKYITSVVFHTIYMVWIDKFSGKATVFNTD